MTSLFLALLTVTSSFSFAALPDYQLPEILARANEADSYNLPTMSFLNSTSPFINNKGDVVFKVMAVEGQNTQSLWVNGKIVYRAPEDKILTDPTMNENGQVIFSIYEELSSDGVFVYDISSKSTKNVLPNPSSDMVAHSYTQILNDGEIFFRGTDINDDRTFYHFTNSLTKVFSEGDNSLGFQASYIFGPVVNSQHQTATKVRLGNKKDWDEKFPDQILLINKDGSFRVIAEDRKSNPISPYAGFTNSVALSENGYVAFIALKEDKSKSLIVDKAGTKVLIATEGKDEISEIELFAPQVNIHGNVLFRAKNLKGLRGLYLADGQSIRRLIGEGDMIPTDLGMGRIVIDPQCPGFGGNVRINDGNEIVFYSVIDSANGKYEWGSAVYKITPVF